MSYRIIIPARFASTRLPGKLLKPIGDKSMLAHVYARCLASGAAQVIIATDTEQLYQHAKSFCDQVCMTHVNHPSGTSRLAQVVTEQGFRDEDIIVNVQGDEPFIDPRLIDQVAREAAQHKDVAITSLREAIVDRQTLLDPHVVKVVTDEQDHALYFSRSPIPYCEYSLGQATATALKGFYRHIGLYAYRADYLKHYASLAPCAMEQQESLEQLRALYYGHRILVPIACASSPVGIDTQADLDKAIAYYQAKLAEQL